MAAVIVIVIVAVGGSSSDNSPSSAAVASAPPLSTADDGDATDPDDLFTATGANGKTYSCSSSVVGQVDAAHDVVTSREAVLRQRRAAVRRLERRYPSGGAPSAVIRRYAELVRRANAQIRFANQAIREYNGLLVSLCEE